jgi:8-oxo-dGTP pyrophosphatase MutT (NUDIX family)
VRQPRESAVFVRRGDRYLVLHRTPDAYWHVVAGVVEPLETFAEAARRELREETGLDASLADLKAPQAYPVPADMAHLYPPGVGVVNVETFWLDVPADWEPVLNEEHDQYRWSTLDEALALLHWPEARDALRAFARLGR